MSNMPRLAMAIAFVSWNILARPGHGQLNEPQLSHSSSFPVQVNLPDPLVMLDGREVKTKKMWLEERRPELIRLFQHYMYGQLPPTPDSLLGTVERVNVSLFDGKATLTEVTLHIGNQLPPIHLMLVVPNNRTRLAPVILQMNYFGNHTLVHDPNVRLSSNWIPERGEGVVDNHATQASRGTWADIWPIEDVIDRGYAVATFYNGDVDPDTPDHRGIQQYFSSPESNDACGTIGAWAWGLQRAVDYLLNAPGIDPQRIIATGHSRLGKAALVAAAFDERIAMVIPHQAGCGGPAPSRATIAIDKAWNTLDRPDTKRPETVADINEKFPHWFNGRFKEFNDQPQKLPIDQNCLIALCAPRPVLLTNGRDDNWINPAGQFAVLQAAAPVYKLLGTADFAANQLPSNDNPIVGVLGYSLRAGSHSLLREDWNTFMDFADRHLGLPGQKDDTDVSASNAVNIFIDSEHPQCFKRQSGDRFFPMGDTAYFLMGHTPETIAAYIDSRHTHCFNFIRIMAVADGFWPFGGTPDNPDYTKIDEASLRKMDWIFDYAAARDINIELILWGYGIGGGEGLWGNPLHENLWVDTLVKRYRERDNLFMYTVANEFERYPEGTYRYDPSDVDWARNIASRIRTLDTQHHISCHPSVWITDQDSGQGTNASPSYNGFTQHRPQVVWPLWDGSHVNLNATQNNEGVQLRTWGDFGTGHGLTYKTTPWQGIEYPVNWTREGWEFEAAGLEDCIAEDWTHGKPVIDTEFGYQYEPGYDLDAIHSSRQSHTPSTVRKKAWKIATSGGYFAAGFASTAVTRNWTAHDIENFRPTQLETLYKFFSTKAEYWTLSPHLELIDTYNSLLAKPGREYVAYFPRGGTNRIRLLAGNYQSEWLQPESGQYFPQPSIMVTDGDVEFTPPNDQHHDWVLHLRNSELH